MVLILSAVAFLAPHGIWLVGCILLAIGSILVPVAYFAGAYGAFSEDSLYGFLYILIPLYAGYYLVTRWEDLWIWIACATVGVGLVLIGTEMVRWRGQRRETVGLFLQKCPQSPGPDVSLSGLQSDQSQSEVSDRKNTGTDQVSKPLTLFRAQEPVNLLQGVDTASQ